METETVSDLLALAKLYGLLNRNGAASQTGSSQLLDEKAHLFLKNLLDGAAKRVLQNHSEIIASQTSVPKEAGSSQVELLPPLSPDISKPMDSAFATQKDEQPRVKSSAHDLIRALSKCSISSNSLGNGSTNCRACEWSSMGTGQKVQKLNNRDSQIHVNNRVIARTLEPPSQRMSRTPACSVNAKVEKKGSRNCDYVHGLRVPLSRHDVAKNLPIPLKVPSRISKDSSVKNLTAHRGNDHKLKWSRRTITPTLLDHKFGQITGSPESFSDTSSQETSSSHSNSYDDSSASFSSQYSSLTSEQNSGSYDESEAYSSSSCTSERTSGSYGESSEAYSSPRWTKKYHKTGPIPKRKAHMARDSSSSSASASASDVISYSSYNTSPSRAKVNKPNNRGKPEKVKARMRGVKNMFGFIFHPFHTNNRGQDQSNEGLEKSKSRWKGVQKMFHSPKNGEVVDVNRGAIQKSGKPGAKGKGKKDAGHLWGMLVHVRKAKKEKPPKGENGGRFGDIGIAQHKQKQKLDTKLKCWQRFNHGTKAKLPKRIGRNKTPKLQS